MLTRRLQGLGYPSSGTSCDLAWRSSAAGEPGSTASAATWRVLPPCGISACSAVIASGIEPASAVAEGVAAQRPERLLDAGAFASGAARELGHDVEMAHMPGVLLQEVESDPFEARWWLAIPSWARLADIGQGVGLDDSVAASGLLAEGHEQVGEGLGVVHEPVSIAAICPWFSNDGTFESPLEPSLFDMSQVLQELHRRPR